MVQIEQVSEDEPGAARECGDLGRARGPESDRDRQGRRLAQGSRPPGATRDERLSASTCIWNCGSRSRKTGRTTRMRCAGSATSRERIRAPHQPRAGLRAAPLSVSRHQPDPRTVHARPRPRRRVRAGLAAVQMPRSAARCSLQPCSFRGAGAAKWANLTGAERVMPPAPLTGDRLVSGFYVNELLLKLFPRHDSHPDVFAAYATLLDRLVDVRQDPRVRCASSRSACWMRSATGSPRARIRQWRAARPRARLPLRARRGAEPLDGVAEGTLIFCGASLLSLAREDCSTRAAWPTRGACCGRRSIAASKASRCARARCCSRCAPMRAKPREADHLLLTHPIQLGVNVDHVATLRQGAAPPIRIRCTPR